MWFTVLVLSQLTPQARYELTCICTGHNLLLLLLPTMMPHMLGVQDEDSRVECDETAERPHPAGALPTQTVRRESCAPSCHLIPATD